MAMTGTKEDTQSFACPRCGATVAERFWGPCSSCRRELVAAHGNGPASDEEVAPAGMTASRFEPSMHVVPNHVATKD
jgi:hypothetical protein